MHVTDRFFTDENIIKMRKGFSKEFYAFFNDGIRDYIYGDWEGARDNLEKAMREKGAKDLPSLKILDFMEHYKYEPPYNWEGKRDLDGGH